MSIICHSKLGVKLAQDHSSGLGLFIRKTVAIGAPIFTESPYVVVPHTPSTPSCINCLRYCGDPSTIIDVLPFDASVRDILSKLIAQFSDVEPSSCPTCGQGPFCSEACVQSAVKKWHYGPLCSSLDDARRVLLAAPRSRLALQLAAADIAAPLPPVPLYVTHPSCIATSDFMICTSPSRATACDGTHPWWDDQVKKPLPVPENFPSPEHAMIAVPGADSVRPVGVVQTVSADEHESPRPWFTDGLGVTCVGPRAAAAARHLAAAIATTSRHCVAFLNRERNGSRPIAGSVAPPPVSPTSTTAQGALQSLAVIDANAARVAIVTPLGAVALWMMDVTAAAAIGAALAVAAAAPRRRETPPCCATKSAPTLAAPCADGTESCVACDRSQSVNHAVARTAHRAAEEGVFHDEYFTAAWASWRPVGDWAAAVQDADSTAGDSVTVDVLIGPTDTAPPTAMRVYTAVGETGGSAGIAAAAAAGSTLDSSGQVAHAAPSGDRTKDRFGAPQSVVGWLQARYCAEWSVVGAPSSSLQRTAGAVGTAAPVVAIGAGGGDPTHNGDGKSEAGSSTVVGPEAPGGDAAGPLLVSFGTALFATHSRMNHSCSPSAAVTVSPTASTRARVCVVARRAIRDGGELTLSYVDPQLRGRRRMEALAKYGIECVCEVCACEDE